MPLFKRKIAQNQTQNSELLEQRYANLLKFQAKIELLKTIKEEEYQTDFLHDIFEACLGYTLKTTNPQNFNLARESKNETDAKKADGAILGTNGEVIGVIELKDQKTRDLDKIEIQAFNYHNSHAKSRYIIISNFDEIRLYIDKKTAYEKFSLFTMSRAEFEFFHQILCFENIISNATLNLLKESENFEQEISKKLYADFSEFRLKLFENAVSLNSQISQTTILSLTQKLCDRIIFVLFAEDMGLLKSNLVSEINDKFTQLKDIADMSLYQIWQKYFEAIDKGSQNLQIPAYNGGLFATDEALNSLKFSDEILQSHIAKLSSYDFASDIGVNILGHIFEQSLSDLEELNSQIIGEKFEKTNSKRKKDGIFYTPEYIVKFIISQTLGQICENEKSRLNLHEIAIPKNPKRLSKDERQTLENIRAYKEFLLGLKIIDPACGSGAFLNGALDFLINEHKNLDKFRKIYEDEALPLYDIEPQILENNLFGVDINADAVQIAKLSLWLRTAQKGRKLTDLSNNIKCGNSLIDDKSVDENAFVWEMEFPEIMANGGFDIVIGNPPYFNIQTFGVASPKAQWIQGNYSEIWQDKSDILFYFIYKALQISKNSVGFIVSNAFLFSDKAQKLRNFIIDDNRLNLIVNFEKYQVFEDASITSCMIIFDKNKTQTNAIVLKDKNYKTDEIIDIINNQDNMFQIALNLNNVFALVDDKIAKVNAKIDANYRMLQDIVLIGKGMETAANGVFLFDNYPHQFPKEFIKKHLVGENIKPYFIEPDCDYLLYFENVENFEDLPQSIQEHLLENKEILQNRATCKNEGRIWHRYSRPMHKEYYHLNKIWCSYRNSKNEFALDENGEYIGLTNTTVIFDTNKNINLKYLLTLLNSKLFFFRYSSIAKQTGNGVFEFFANSVGKFKFPEISIEKQQPFIELADKLIELNSNLQSTKTEFLRELNLEKIPQKLAEFENLEFDEFIKEYAKAKKEKFADKLAEVKFKNYYQGFFSEYKSQTLSLKSQISQSENELNSLVYALYDLTADEIALIENS